MIPYDDVIARADRRWTSALLARLLDPKLPESELEDLVTALQTLADPRSFAPLQNIVCDRGRPPEIRESASDILHGTMHVYYEPPEAEVRRWWHEGDDILRRHALAYMGGTRCRDLVLQLASDPSHEYQALALGRMMFWFDRPEYAKIKIEALSHPNPRVRENAATILLWDETAAAEGPLVEATFDPELAVTVEAIYTLQYYPTRRVISRLHELGRDPNERISSEARKSLEEIRSSLSFELCRRDQRVRDRVHAWLAPVWDLLAFTEEELHVDEDDRPYSPPTRKLIRHPIKTILALLADPDTSPNTLNNIFLDIDWASYSGGQRQRLSKVLLAHPDPLVRAVAPAALAAWRDVDGLLGLLGDPDFGIRKTAMYHLGTLPPSPHIAERVWVHLEGSDVLGVHATESLSSYSHHAPPDLAVPRLAALANDRTRPECIQLGALHGLEKHRASDAIRELLPRLQEPPGVTWALHTALLYAAVNLSLPLPDVSHLGKVDHLEVQAALAELPCPPGF